MEKGNASAKSTEETEEIKPNIEKLKSTRVYVGNLPWNVSWQNLKDHFRAAGVVVHASVFADESGRSKVLLNMLQKKKQKKLLNY